MTFAFDPEELFVATGPKAPNYAWKPVTCVRCRKSFRCTPDTDYYTTIKFTVPKDAESGFCWDCLCIVTGLTSARAAAGKGPQPEPHYRRRR
jgi:hypothetical protein